MELKEIQEKKMMELNRSSLSSFDLKRCVNR